MFGIAANLDYDLARHGFSGAKARVGSNYVMNTLSLKLGGIYSINDSYYIGGNFLLPASGAEAVIGMNFKLETGMINAEIGYGALKYSSSAAALKGLNLTVGYGYAF